MRVSELIELLQEFDPDDIVVDKNGDEIEVADDSEAGFVYLEV